MAKKTLSKAEEIRARMKKNAPKLSDVKNANKKDNSDLGYQGGEYLDFEDGKSVKYSFFPSHNEGENFFFMRKRYWLPVEKDNGDIGKTTVPDSIKHGGTKMDIVNEFSKLGQIINKKDKDKIKLLTDSYGGGIGAQIDWVAYAIKHFNDERNFGILPFKKSVRDEINKINFIEEDDSPVEAIDTFTGEFYPLIVKYLSKPNKKKGEDYYACQKGKKPIELTDEELEAWDAAKPLADIYGPNTYTLKDFEKALECLRLFDEQEEMGVFDDDRWDEIVEEVRAQYEDADEDEDDEDEKPKNKKKSTKKPAAKKSSKKDEDEDEEDEDDDEDDDDTDEDDDSDDDDDDDDSDDEDDEDEDEDDEEEDEDDEDEEEEEKPAKKSPSKKTSAKATTKSSAKSKKKDDDEDDDEEDEKPQKKGKINLDDIRERLKNKKKK